MRRDYKTAIWAGAVGGLLVYSFIIRPRQEIKHELKLAEQTRKHSEETRILWTAYQETMRKIRGGEYSGDVREQALSDFEFSLIAQHYPDLLPKD